MADKAVHVRGARKSYGFRQFSTSVLQNLDMDVPAGSIYGLLGASGCGKTTLLTCVVGQRRLDSGELLVLGNRPGSRGSGVPGRRVGYMPQELGLLKEFTVRRAMYYFGWICNMADDDIEKQYRFLARLLDLPKGGCSIKNLSGGQQRRVSLAAALVHSPELLVLDEPTVGLDPVLRHSIWDHLTRLMLERNATIIITTHYIEEARHANVIGLMRQGRLVAEDSPQKLLSLYECPTLEQVFLKLSVQQSKRSGPIEDASHTSTLPAEVNIDTFSLQEINTKQLQPDASTQQTDEDNVNTLEAVNKRSSTSITSDFPMLPALRRMKALLVKNCLQVVLNPECIMIVAIIPTLVTYLFFYSIGGYPKSLHLAVSNQEIGNYSSCEEFESHQFTGVSPGCHFSGLSCVFLALINDSIALKDCVYASTVHDLTTLRTRIRDVIAAVTMDLLERTWQEIDYRLDIVRATNESQEYYTDKEDALATVRTGHAISVIHFAANFSRELEKRYKLGSDASRRTLEHSEIQMHMDMSDQQLSIPMKLMFYDKFKEFLADLAISCNNSPKATQIPIQWNEPVYGVKTPRYIDYVAPRFFITVVFFMATSLSTALIITDKSEGIWNRNLVAGVSQSEILCSHFLCEMFFVIIICAETILVATVIHDYQCKGSMSIFVSLIFLQAICGMLYGFLISVLCNNFLFATYMSIGSYVPFCVLCGVLWPIEGMGPGLARLSLFMPCTLANMSAGNIAIKGGDLTDPEVYMGFVSTLVWIIAQCTVCLVALKIKK